MIKWQRNNTPKICRPKKGHLLTVTYHPCAEVLQSSGFAGTYSPCKRHHQALGTNGLKHYTPSLPTAASSSGGSTSTSWASWPLFLSLPPPLNATSGLAPPLPQQKHLATFSSLSPSSPQQKHLGALLAAENLHLANHLIPMETLPFPLHVTSFICQDPHSVASSRRQLGS